MSPTENDLRAALHDGDGDGVPDVDGLIAHARGRRAQRRTRVLSTAAAVVVVAAAAVGGAVVWNDSGDGGPQSAGTPTYADRAGSAGSSSGADHQAVETCPSTYPGRTIPGNALSSNAAGPMFASPVSAVMVCGYTETGKVGSVSLTGSDATLLAQSIESASTSRLQIMCPDIVSAQRKELAIVASTSDGRQLPMVTTDVSIPNCNQPITNGTAVRWAWKPPTALESTISAVTSAVTAGSGAKSGTPAR